MFTGIIEAVGHIAEMQRKGNDMRLRIDTGKLNLNQVKLGDSIAVSGVCLTVVALPGNGFWADVSNETLSCTVLGELRPGAPVNLEQALTPSSRLGGHMVSGHVDGIGQVTRFAPDGRSWRLSIRPPTELSRYIAAKGSICVDGISLTVNEIDAEGFDVNIVPHTRQETTIADYQIGRQVNLEVDIIARYLERLLLPDRNTGTDDSNGLSKALLQARGFL